MFRKTGCDGVTGVVPDRAVSRPWDDDGACDVEVLLIWALRDQKARPGDATRGLMRVEAEAMGLDWRASSTDGCAVVAEIGRIGCRIDVSPGGPPPRLHPVAEMVSEVLEQIPHGRLLIDHARLGIRPEAWRARPRWIVPEALQEGSDDGVWVFDGRRNGPRYVPVLILCSEQSMALGRDEYRRWREALCWARWVLAQKALGFAVTGPEAPEAPWDGVDNGVQV